MPTNDILTPFADQRVNPRVELRAGTTLGTLRPGPAQTTFILVADREYELVDFYPISPGSLDQEIRLIVRDPDGHEYETVEIPFRRPQLPPLPPPGEKYPEGSF